MLAIALVGVVSARRLRIGSEITHFLPADADARLAHVSRAIAQSELARTIILAVDAPDADAAVAAGRALAERIEHHPEVAWLRRGVDAQLERAVHDGWFPRRLAFLSDHPERDLSSRLSDEGLQRAARDARARLATPMAPFLGRILGADPLLSFPAVLERLQGAQSGTLGVRDGQFVTDDGRHAVLFLATRHSPFDGAVQRPFLAAVDAAFAAVNRAHGGRLRLRQSSVHHIAVEAEAQVRADVDRITLASTLAIVAFFLLIHRSLRYLLIASLPLGAGMVAALAVCSRLFGSIHGLTLAFGASLIGVCLDYPVYYINHHTLEPDPAGAYATLRRVWSGLRLGAFTTIGGLAGMAWTSFPGIREIAVFSSVGVLGALLTSRYLLWPFMPEHPRAVPMQRRLADALGRAYAALRSSPRSAAVLPALALIVCAVGLRKVQWVDDARALSNLNAAMLREDDAVRALVSPVDTGRFVVALGRDDEEALRVNDALVDRLEAARVAGALDGWRSLHALLWSADLQRRNLAVLRGADLAQRLPVAFAREGFRPGAFEAFRRDLAAPPPAPLSFDDLRDGPLAVLARPFRIPVGERVGVLTFLSNVRDATALRRHLAGAGDVHYFDQAEFLRETYARYRRRTLQLIGVGLLAVYALIFARYRRVGRSLAAFVPAVLAAATTLAALGIAGIEANLLHLLGLLLVLSMGADYAIFMAETEEHPEMVPATLLSIVLACIATVLSFGMLAISANPALRAIGLSTGLGMFFSLLFAPLANLLLGGRRR